MDEVSDVPESRSARRLRRAFLAVGLLPGLYGMRRLPLGIWFEVGALSGIATGIALFAAVFARGRWRRRLLRIGGALAALAALGIGLANLAIADARDADGLPTGPVRAITLLGQVVIAWLAVRATPAYRRHVIGAYGAALLTAAVLGALGPDAPAPIPIVLVGVVAARLALLPVASWSRRRLTWSSSALLVWSAGALVVETGTLHRPYGLAIGALALVVGAGVLILTAQERHPRAVLRPVLLTAVALPVLASLFVLVPSRESMRWLMERGFTPPSRFEPRAEHLLPTRYELWFDTEQSRDEALVDAHLGLGAYVSEWTGTLGNDIDGHLVGYRLDVRVWASIADGGARPPEAKCRHETRTCVLVVLRRSDDRESAIPSKPLRLPDVDPRSLSPR